MTHRHAHLPILALAALLAACGATDDPGVRVPDAGGALDSGSSVDDSGTSADDAGTAAPDSGLAPIDAGPSGPVTFETVFSRRLPSNARDTAIEDRLVQLIDAAQPGSRIRIAIYSFTRSPPADALIRAAARGVDVRILLDGGAGGLGSEIGALQTGLGAANVHVCDGPGTSCIGSGIMHHKTFLFSALSDGSTNVVLQASHNLTTTQLSMHNNTVIVRGDAALFAAYERTWNDLWADVEIPNYYRVDDGGPSTRVYFFPRPTGGDTVAEVLGAVTCDGSARIRVAMAFFTDARGAVASALAARASEGCDVQVVAGDESIPLGPTVASTLTAAGVGLVRFPNRGGWSLHSKYLLIDASFEGSAAHRRLVFTGSHNWTGAALEINDETMLRVEDDAVFDAFLADWVDVRTSATTP